MTRTDHEAAWAILTENKNKRAESRTAFIAALIVERTARIIDKGSEGVALFTMQPHHAEAYAAEFVRLATAIKREAEAACSYERTPSQEARDEKNQARFRALAEALGFEASTGGDPRGPCARLIDPSQRQGDGWGEGWAVYA